MNLLYEDDDKPETVPIEQKDDYPIPGYKKFFTPTESSAGGISLYELKNLTHKPREDQALSKLVIISPRKFEESLFVLTLTSSQATGCCFLIVPFWRHCF